MIVAIGHIERPVAIQGESKRVVEAAGAHATLVHHTGGKVALLTKDPIGSCIASLWCEEEQDAMIVAVGYIEIAGAIHGQAAGIVQRVGADCTASVRCRRVQINLTKDAIRDRIAAG